MCNTVDHLQDIISEIQFALQESYPFEGFLSSLGPLQRGLTLCTTPLERDLFFVLLQKSLKHNL